MKSKRIKKSKKSKRIKKSKKSRRIKKSRSNDGVHDIFLKMDPYRFVPKSII